MNIAKKGQTKTEIEDEKLKKQMEVLDQVQKIFEKLSNDLTKKIGTDMEEEATGKDTTNKRTIIAIFEQIEKIIDNDKYKILSKPSNLSIPSTLMTDEEKMELGINIMNIDKYLTAYKQFVQTENKFAKREMIRIYDDVNIIDNLFVMERSLGYLKFYHDFVQQTENIRNRLYAEIQRSIKKIEQEMSTSNMMKDYVASLISNTLATKVKGIKLKPIADAIKIMSKEIRDLVPRTKSEHVGISMHKIRGGKQNELLWKNMFNKYNRNDLNLISKHYGLKNNEKVKNKKTIINNLNAIILYRSGKFNKRKELNLFSKLFGINPKLYKRKKDLIHKLNQTIF
jgi:hypothetical protein